MEKNLMMKSVLKILTFLVFIIARCACFSPFSSSRFPSKSTLFRLPSNHLSLMVSSTQPHVQVNSSDIITHFLADINKQGTYAGNTTMFNPKVSDSIGASLFGAALALSISNSVWASALAAVSTDSQVKSVQSLETYLRDVSSKTFQAMTELYQVFTNDSRALSISHNFDAYVDFVASAQGQALDGWLQSVQNSSSLEQRERNFEAVQLFLMQEAEAIDELRGREREQEKERQRQRRDCLTVLCDMMVDLQRSLDHSRSSKGQSTLAETAYQTRMGSVEEFIQILTTPRGDTPLKDRYLALVNEFHPDSQHTSTVPRAVSNALMTNLTLAYQTVSNRQKLSSPVDSSTRSKADLPINVEPTRMPPAAMTTDNVNVYVDENYSIEESLSVDLASHDEKKFSVDSFSNPQEPETEPTSPSISTTENTYMYETPRTEGRILTPGVDIAEAIALRNRQQLHKPEKVLLPETRPIVREEEPVVVSVSEEKKNGDNPFPVSFPVIPLSDKVRSSGSERTPSVPSVSVSDLSEKVVREPVERERPRKSKEMTSSVKDEIERFKAKTKDLDEKSLKAQQKEKEKKDEMNAKTTMKVKIKEKSLDFLEDIKNTKEKLLNESEDNENIEKIPSESTSSKGQTKVRNDPLVPRQSSWFTQRTYSPAAQRREEIDWGSMRTQGSDLYIDIQRQMATDSPGSYRRKPKSAGAAFRSFPLASQGPLADLDSEEESGVPVPEGEERDDESKSAAEKLLELLEKPSIGKRGKPQNQIAAIQKGATLKARTPKVASPKGTVAQDSGAKKDFTRLDSQRKIPAQSPKTFTFLVVDRDEEGQEQLQVEPYKQVNPRSAPGRPAGISGVSWGGSAGPQRKANSWIDEKTHNTLNGVSQKASLGEDSRQQKEGEKEVGTKFPQSRPLNDKLVRYGDKYVYLSTLNQKEQQEQELQQRDKERERELKSMFSGPKKREVASVLEEEEGEEQSSKESQWVRNALKNPKHQRITKRRAEGMS